MLVLHYTGMPTGEAAIARLCDPACRVSSHYVVEEDGTVWRLVPEARRAWHAGISFWRGHHGLNGVSARADGGGARPLRRDFGAPPDPRPECRRPFRHRAGPQAGSGRIVRLAGSGRGRHRALAEVSVCIAGSRCRRRGVAGGASAHRLPGTAGRSGRRGLGHAAACLPAPLAAWGRDGPRGCRDGAACDSAGQHCRTNGLTAGAGCRNQPAPDGWTAAAMPAEGMGEESPGSTGIRCRLTAGGGDPRDSATENKPPARSPVKTWMLAGKGETVR
jgi:hypothetical protein